MRRENNSVAEKQHVLWGKNNMLRGDHTREAAKGGAGGVSYVCIAPPHFLIEITLTLCRTVPSKLGHI